MQQKIYKKTLENRRERLSRVNGADRFRTCDPQTASLMLSQLSYSPV
jgi:hypothetical protein